MPRERCAEFLREVCGRWVTHRRVPEREIEAAVALAYGGYCGHQASGRRRDSGGTMPGQGGYGALKWPGADAGLIGHVTQYAAPAFDGVTDTGRTAGEVGGSGSNAADAAGSREKVKRKSEK